MLAGGAAGTSFWLATYPIDVIKSGIQVDSHTNPMYRGTWDCTKKVANRFVPSSSLIMLSDCTLFSSYLPSVFSLLAYFPAARWSVPGGLLSAHFGG